MIEGSRMQFSTKKLLGIYLSWWLFWAGVQTFVLHRLQLAWEISVVDALISNALLALIACAAMLMYRFYQPGRSNGIYRLLFSIALPLLHCSVLNWTLSRIYPQNTGYLLFLEKSLPVRFIFSMLIISSISLINWIWSALLEQKENEKRKSDSEQLMKEAELTKLRQQLQPHFLFNSLNSISALIGTKPAEARKMIQQLSDFLRGTLKKEDKLVQLSEEIEHLKLYLDIEKVRFGHRLHIEFNLSDESLGNMLPSLLLQPIVENAIKFGLYDVAGEVTISISTSVNKNYLHVEIRNPFDPGTRKAQQGVGFGLSSIQRRLYLLYARQDLLATEKQDHTFITTLKIPQAV